MSRLRNLWSRIQQEITRRHDEQVTRQERSRRRRSLLNVESLEQRVVLAVVTWDGGGGNLEWANDLNWSTDSQPTASDDVIIGDLSGTPTITVGTNVQVQSVNSQERVQINRGGFQIYFGTGTFNNGLDLDPSFLIPGQPSPTLGLSSLTLYGNSTWYDPGTIDAQITNYGTIDLTVPSSGTPGFSTFNNYGSFFIQGDVVAAAVGFNNMTNQVGALMRANANVGSFNNLGTVVTTTSGLLSSVNNQGTVRVESGGTLSLPFHGSGSTLSGGNWEVKGTLDMFALPVGGITTVGPGTTVRIEDSGSFPAILTATQNNGSLYLANTSFVTGISAFTNSGTLTIDGGSYSQSGGNGYTQAAGSTILKNGATLNGDVTLTGGTIRGSGTVSGTTFTNSGGTLAPGASPGVINISGNYVQTSSGVLEIEVGGPNSANPDYDQLNISGSATLAGTLRATLISGFIPDFSENYQFMTYASKIGDFGTYQMPILNGSNVLYPIVGGTFYSLGSNAWAVRNTNDSGQFSLRSAITGHNNLGGEIYFQVGGTISPLSPLPTISNSGVIIDGTTISTYAGVPLVELRGDLAGTSSGLEFGAAGAGSQVKGLAINRFSDHGIYVHDSDNISVFGSYLGLDLTGAAAPGNGGGIRIDNSTNVVIGGAGQQRNVISGNVRGIVLSGSLTNGTWIENNYIGTDKTGLVDLGNTLEGVRIQGGATANSILDNVISGNESAGISISDATSIDNEIWHNIIGLGADGSTVIANNGGISVNDASGTLIGGNAPSARNIISGNNLSGITINFGASSTIVSGNYIGTDITGLLDRGNQNAGIEVANGSHDNVIGGTDPGAGNVISGNNFGGNIVISSAGTVNNVVQQNIIGLNATGTASIAGHNGILIEGGAQSNTIGGSSTAARNFISGNGGDGIRINGSSTDSNIISGNYIGTNLTGTAAIANSGSGVLIQSGAANNTIGGLPSFLLEDGFDGYFGGNQDANQPGTGLALSYGGNLPGWNKSGLNSVHAVNLGGGNFAPSFYDNNAITMANGIGANQTGNDYIVSLDVGPSVYATLGQATLASDGIVVSVLRGNNSVLATHTILPGAWVTGPNAQNLTNYSFNYTGDGSGDVRISIATNTVGAGRFGGAVDNLKIQDAASNRNVISGNNGFGVYIEGVGSINNKVERNYIGVQSDGTSSLPNTAGALSVSVGATLKGTGTYSGNVLNEGTIAPGNSPGIITVNGDYTQSSSATLQIEIQGTNPTVPDFDQLFVNGAVSLAGTLDVSLLGGFNPSVGNSFKIIDNDGSDAITGTFTGLPEGATVSGGGATFQVSYVGGTGNDVVLITTSAVPFVVTNNNDSGAGSLRQAVLNANSHTGPDRILFQIPGSGVQTIAPTSALPAITEAVHINGTTQTGFTMQPVVEIRGDNAGTGVNGFTITASGSIIEGLVINRFEGSGVIISGAGSTGNTIRGNHIGTDATGLVDLGNGEIGVLLSGSPNNVIGGTTTADRNVISGNNQHGVKVVLADGNTIVGNYVGLGADGETAVGNTSNGIYTVFSSNTTIGGSTTGARNVVSGNLGAGIALDTGTGSIVSGNYVGVTADGTAARLNSNAGISVAYLTGATIGGEFANERNVVVSNSTGIGVGPDSHGTEVLGNYVGTDAAGTVGLTTGGTGVSVYFSNNVTVGGGTAAARNVILQGAGSFGVFLQNSTGVKVQGNYIGVDVTGNVSVASNKGILLAASTATIGTDGDGTNDATEGNVIAGASINIDMPALGSGTVIAGNKIGTNAAGTAILGSSSLGIRDESSGSNRIGSNADGISDALERNIIAGASSAGIFITAPNTVIAGNYIGTNATGSAALPNGFGVQIAASDITVGGITPAARNLISGNSGAGVYSAGAGTGNAIQGNYFGVNASGTAPLPNYQSGNNALDIVGRGTIGGLTSVPGTGAGNLFGGTVQLTSASNVRGNTFGLQADGTTVLDVAVSATVASSGIRSEAAGSTIGGTAAGSRNVFAGYGSANFNGNSYLDIMFGGTNTVQGNYFGTDISGLLNRNTGDVRGIQTAFGATGNIVGGSNAAARNVIVGGTRGFETYEPGNTFEGNYVGIAADGVTAYGMSQVGVFIRNNNNIIRGNVISGSSTVDGLRLEDTTTGTLVVGNYIGTDASGTLARPNLVGISVGTSGNTIGGPNAVDRNVISGNSGYGLRFDFGSTNNIVQGNFVGVQSDGTTSLLNTNGAMFVSSNATLKGTGSFTGNVLNQGTIAPGNSPGIVTINGDYTQVAGASLQIEIQGTNPTIPDFDQLFVNGAVSLAGTLDVSLLGGFVPSLGNSFQIITNDGSDPSSGTFSGLAEGATIAVGQSIFTISYAGGDGNDVVLTKTANHVTWDGGGDGVNWSDPINWDLNLLPVATDTVIIPTGVTVTHASGFNTVAGVSGAGSLSITGDVLTVNGTINLGGTLALSAGNLNGTQTIVGTMNWSGGYLAGERRRLHSVRR